MEEELNQILEEHPELLETAISLVIELLLKEGKGQEVAHILEVSPTV